MRFQYSIIAVLLFVSCTKTETTNKVSLMAEKTATDVRAKWKTLRLPIEIELSGYNDQEQKMIQKLGVYVCKTTDMTEDEYISLAGVPFIKHNNIYVSEHPNVMLTDTVAEINICYPFRKDLAKTDTLRIRAPYCEQLYGKELKRTIDDAVYVNVELKSSMALLRICIESDDLHDRLDALQVSGEPVCTEADYLVYSGRWLNRYGIGGKINASDAQCLLNNGRQHDFYLIPTDSAATITVAATVNGKEFAMKTAVPPLYANSLTRIGLKLNKGVLQTGSSWVETQRKLSLPITPTVDSVKVGDFLLADGSIIRSWDSAAVAVVIETDGLHGKAVAISDCVGERSYGKKQLSSGLIFTSIDGTRKEGIINPHKADNISEAEAIVYKPGIPYKDCALAYTDGATLTQTLMKDCEEGIFADIADNKGSYIPTLAELAMLYYILQPYTLTTMPDNFITMNGSYLSCSEIPNNSIYTLDFTSGAITSCSKAYGKAKLRLFYLF